MWIVTRETPGLEPEFADYVDELDADRVAAGLPRIPALPARTVLAVWPVGTGGKHPIGPELLGQELPHDLLAFLGADSTSRKPHLRSVLLGTTGPAGSLPIAQTQADSASWLPRWFATAQAEALAINAAEPVSATDPAEVDRQVSAWLHAQDDQLVDVGAVVLVPVGAKPLNDGALLALQRWTLDRGLPFYLRSHHKGAGPARHFLLPARLAGDRMLTGVALWALHRLEYETAARLLRAGSTDLTGYAERCERLGRAFRRDRANDPWPDGSPRTTLQRGAGLASARVALVRDRLDNEANEAEAVRLLHLAYTLLEASIDSADADRWFETRIRSYALLDLRTLHRSGTDDDARRVVHAMRALRNALPTSHPDGDLRLHEIIERELGEATRYRLCTAKRLPTPAELVAAYEWALRQPVWEGWPSRSRPDRRLLDLDRQLAADLTSLAAKPE